jgi:hypothetical protein
MILCMNLNISDLEDFRRSFLLAWWEELVSDDPDWMKLFEIHYELVSVERRLRRRRRIA